MSAPRSGVSDEEFERVHDGLVSRHGVHMAEDSLRRILDVALEDRVPAEQLQERYDAGKRRMRAKHADLQDAVKALEIARAMVQDMIVWSGPESRRDQVTAQLDRAIKYFTP